MTSRDLHVVWGVNRWVLVETPNESVEQQVASKEDLAALLTQVGLAAEEAKAAAREHWRRRPGDAGGTAARPDESGPRGTTISQLFGSVVVVAIAFVLLLLCLAFLVFLLAIVFGGPLPGGD